MTLGDHVIGTLYVQKALFGGRTPEKVGVTVEWEQSGTEIKLDEYAILG